MKVNEYETTVLLPAGWAEARVSAIGEKFAQLVTDKGGTILHRIYLGKRDLSYEIGKEKRASYLFLNYAVAPEAIKDLETWLRYEDGVMRFMSVQQNTDVDVAARKATSSEDLKKLEKYFGSVVGASAQTKVTNEETEEPAAATA